MQSSATTAEDVDDAEKPSVVKSVRFLRDQWTLVLAKTAELGIQPGQFIRNATLVACGTQTEADRHRAIANALDGIKDAPAVPARPKPPAKAPAKTAPAAKRKRA